MSYGSKIRGRSFFRPYLTAVKISLESERVDLNSMSKGYPLEGFFDRKSQFFQIELKFAGIIPRSNRRPHADLQLSVSISSSFITSHSLMKNDVI